MAFTVEPSTAQIIDLSDSAKRTKQYAPGYNELFESSETVEKVIVFDPRKDIILQLNTAADTYTLEVTSHAGEGNNDILDAAVPWVVLKSAESADFHSGSGLNNRGVLAVRITTGVLTDDFEIFAAQQNLGERAG